MGGGIVQLSAYGSQDIYLTSRPEITYFKSIFKRHTNFSMESIIQLTEGNINFGGNITVTVARNGDLLGNQVVQVCLPDPKMFVTNPNSYQYLGWIQGVGNYLIKYVSIEIGGQQIDEQYGQWMDIWSQLNLNESQVYGYGLNVGKSFSSDIWQPYPIENIVGSRLQIPLLFWYCRNPGLAIPLVCLQFSDVKLKMTFEKFENLIVAVNNGQYITPVLNGYLPTLNPREFKIWNTYYFLDSTERRKFAQNPHEYLIEQIQTQSGTVESLTLENNIRINLSHPTKELIFTFTRNDTSAPQNDFSIGTNIIPNGSPSQFAPVYSLKLIINGTDRFKERPGEYFRTVQAYDHHTRIPSNYIYVYSFAIKPEEYQPSGTCNFSRIDSSSLNFFLRNSLSVPGNLDSSPLENYTNLPDYNLYAPCYNIMRIFSGKCGLAYNS
jgi:hypothetical protein